MIKKIEEITILASKFKIDYNPNHNQGVLNYPEGLIEIGIKCLETDPLFTINIISHEIMEGILIAMGARYEHTLVDNNYLFSFNHQTFENAIQLHTEIMSKFYDRRLGSKELIGGVQESFNEHKKAKSRLEYKSYYNGWLDGRLELSHKNK
jgi:hypothetical protein